MVVEFKSGYDTNYNRHVEKSLKISKG